MDRGPRVTARTTAKLLTGRAGLDELTVGVRKAAALKAALELEVFTRIAEGHRSLPAFRRATGFGERQARLLLDALANIGLLARTDLEYTLSPTAETYLVKGKPTYYGDLLLAQWSWEARAQTARAVRTGKLLNAWLEAHQNVARAPLYWFDPEAALQEARTLWSRVPIAPHGQGPLRIVAFGVEAGLCALSLLMDHGDAKLLVVDHAMQMPRLRQIVSSDTPTRILGGTDDPRADASVMALVERIEWQEGDWITVALPTDAFDVAVVDSITETRSIEENIGILHHAYETLAMGGWIVLRAVMEDDDRRGPDLVPLFGLDLLLGSVDGDVYTRTEYKGMLEAAGFFEVKPLEGHVNVWTARRLPPPPPPPPAATLAPDFIPAPELLT